MGNKTPITQTEEKTVVEKQEMPKSMEIQSLRNEEGYYKNVESYKNRYGGRMYYPARPADYDWPCSTPGCTEDNRLCQLHKLFLFVKVMVPIPPE